MEDGNGFKHITVSAEDAPDEVIYAGMAAPDVRDDMRLPHPDPLAAEPVSDKSAEAVLGSRRAGTAPNREGLAEDGRVGPSAGECVSGVPADSEKEGPAGQGGGVCSRVVPKAEVPDELDVPPMPWKQRIVIAAAAICLIGAIVYYAVLMR